MNWTKATAILSSLFNEYVKKYVVQFVLKTIGVSGGIWTSIVSFVLTRVFVFAKKEAESAARLADQAKKDEQLLDQYKEAIKNDVPESELINIETDILNSGRKP